MENHSKLGDYLVESKIISQVQLDAALAEQKITSEKLGAILVRDGFMTRGKLVEVLLKLNPDSLNEESHYTSLIPPEVLLKWQTMVVAETPDSVYVSSYLPEYQVLPEIEPYCRPLKVRFGPADIDKLDAYLGYLDELVHGEQSVLDRVLYRAFNENASDIHIIPRHASYSVFFRRLGVRGLVHEGTIEEYNSLAARIKDLSKMDLAERRIPQDGGFQTEHNGRLVDLRVATVPTGNSEYVIIRLLDPDNAKPSLDGLGITRVAEWRKGTSRNSGLNLICGPTGSGKTTTLNATIRELDRFGSAIFTLEDPVEYRVPYVGQVNINNNVGLDYARGIRAFMRSDPDIIIVGEIRDQETARNAIRAAETGHMVIGTLHTETIFGAVQRLKDLDVPAFELTYLLRSVLVQSLIRTVCKVCHGEGCAHCHQAGFTGRTIVSECNYFSDEQDVARMLKGERWWPSRIEDALTKADSGQTSMAEVLRVFGEEGKNALLLREAQTEGVH